MLGVYYHDKVKYAGNTVSSPVFDQFAYGAILGYTFTKGDFYGQVAGGLAGESNKISGTRTNSLIPIAQINTQYAFNQKNSISLSAQYNVNPVEAADKTPDIIQENELLYKTGNLHLKNTHWGKVSLDYTWLPNNMFSVSAFTGGSRYFNRLMPIFTPDGPDGLMLRSLENNGDYQDFYIGGSISVKLLNRKLVLKDQEYGLRKRLVFILIRQITSHSLLLALTIWATFTFRHIIHQQAEDWCNTA